MTEPLERQDDPSLVAPPDTKTSLLEAAERQFAEEGVDRATLRSITQAAQANLAAVHYHFGSKEGLVREVLSRRLGPLNRRRLELLDAVEGSSTEAPDLDSVVRAFVQPAIEMVDQDGGHAFARFVCRTFSEPDESFREIVLDQFKEILDRFSSAFARALPNLPREELFWRFHFMVGSMVHTAGLGFVAERISCGLCDPGDTEGLTDRLVSFLSAGLRAEATEGRSSG